ncbi:MAG: hypothetical protein ACRD3P_08010 [Terriglobales bacterium]
MLKVAGQWGMKPTSILLAVIGYLQAAMFYWRWGGIPRVSWLCFLCPNIDSVGSNWEKFIRRTISMGTINAAALIGIYFAIYLVHRLLRKWSETR